MTHQSPLWTWADLHPVPPCPCGAPTLPRPFQCVHQYIEWRASLKKGEA